MIIGKPKIMPARLCIWRKRCHLIMKIIWSRKLKKQWVYCLVYCFKQ